MVLDPEVWYFKLDSG